MSLPLIVDDTTIPTMRDVNVKEIIATVRAHNTGHVSDYNCTVPTEIEILEKKTTDNHAHG